MLDSSFLKILLFTLILSSCGGGNSSATSPSESSFVSQPKSINGLVVDGYIRNADIWIETTNDFSNIGETKTSSNLQGRFSLTTSLTDYRVQSSGGIDLDTNRVAFCKNKGLNAEVLNLSDEKNNTYDLITMFHSRCSIK